MRQRTTATVNKPWLNREPQPIVLPVSLAARHSSSLHTDATVTLPSRSCALVCRLCCHVSLEAGARFCGMCGSHM